MQRILNYGSSLQAYALRRLIEQAVPDARVTFVDYEPSRPLVGVSREAAMLEGRLGRTIAKLRDYSQVDASWRDKFRFFNHKRRYAALYFPLVGIPAVRDRNLALDLQVIGSDEVFNCVQANTNVGYSRDLFGHGSPARRIASYAGSFGNTTLSKIEAAGIRTELEEDFARFAAISVRDRNSQEIVAALTGKLPTIHLDPTLVHDFALVPPPSGAARDDLPRYAIVYGYSGRFTSAENDAVRRYANRAGVKILALGGLQACADEFIDCDPFTLLAYFRGAEAVVTDTFHGTIFSVISEVPFATVVRPSKGEGYGNEEKLGYLLDVLGLASRRVRNVAELEHLLSGPPDFTEARALRNRERVRTLTYLKGLLVDQVGGTGA